MTRTVDLGNRAALLERVSAYVLDHGLADLSLRPLAKAVGSSPRALLYHFGSKEAIVAEVLARIRKRQLTVFDQMRRSELSTPAAVCRAAWTYMSTPQFLPMLRLFFETYALALRDPQRFPGFFEGAVEDWLRFLSDPICKGDMDPRRARTIATVMLAGFRGLMLDFAATQDSERIEAALDMFANTLDALHPHEERGHAQQA
jgi:AcrR family transcriptional regulator